MTTDAELVRSARRGNATAQADLVRRWSGRVLAVCRARIGRRDVVEDLAQEAMLRGLQNLDSLEDPAKFGAWLRGIAVRVCFDWLRGRSNEQVPFSTLTEAPLATIEGDEGLARFEADEERRQVFDEIQALPEPLRETVMLYYYEDLTYQDIADFLEVSRATVNARLAKARELLAKRLAPQAR